MNLKTKLLLATLPILLFVGFCVQLSLSIAEDFNEVSSNGFAVDTRPNYSVGSYHLILIPLIFAMFLGRRYFVSIALATGYLLFHFWVVHLILQGCFLGVDICPPVALWTKMIVRFSWFDWIATALIPLILLSCVFAAVTRLDPRRTLP